MNNAQRTAVLGVFGLGLLAMPLMPGPSRAEPAGLPPLREVPLEAGASVALRCVACHGPLGNTDNPTFPKLAGQHASYLAEQLRHFRSGERYHPIMSPIAQTLSDSEINAVALYFSLEGGRESKRSRLRRAAQSED
ncbi:MAG: c-type cytochrome [Alphaproteobacteria bacterium]|nr:c-type cytochrome [Alphaproteobacteria bacterium]